MMLSLLSDTRKEKEFFLYSKNMYSTREVYPWVWEITFTFFFFFPLKQNFGLKVQVNFVSAKMYSVIFIKY